MAGAVVWYPTCESGGDRSPNIPSLTLDHNLVLSAWQKMGGEVRSDAEGPLVQSLTVDLGVAPAGSTLHKHDSSSFASMTDFDFELTKESAYDFMPATGTSPYIMGSTSVASGLPDIAGYYNVNEVPAYATSAYTPPPQIPQYVMPVQSQYSQINGCGGETRTRKQCLQRYREKKARRLYTKKIRYELRKINADKRPRIKGRFVKKEELEEYLKQKETGLKKLPGSC